MHDLECECRQTCETLCRLGLQLTLCFIDVSCWLCRAPEVFACRASHLDSGQDSTWRSYLDGLLQGSYMSSIPLSKALIAYRLVRMLSSLPILCRQQNRSQEDLGRACVPNHYCRAQLATSYKLPCDFEGIPAYLIRLPASVSEVPKNSKTPFHKDDSEEQDTPSSGYGNTASTIA